MADRGTDAPMRRALFLDTETTGLDASVDRVVEVAVILFDLELGCPIESYASLIQASGNAAESANGIPPAALADANHAIEVWRRVAEVAAKADVIAAHNAEFDRSFLRAAGIASVADRPFVCTMSDFDWGGSRKLVEIALNHGVGVASIHRALADVDTMARLFARVRERGGDLPALFRRAARPKKRFVAMVSYEARETAKQNGFMWDPQRREWYRNLPEEDAGSFPFRVREVAP